MILSGIYGKWRWAISQYAEKRWWNSYLKDKDQYEYLNWKKQYWSKFLQTIEIDISEDRLILDAGCGPAGIFLVLNNNRVVAIDSLLDGYVKNGLLNNTLYSNVEFINTSVEDYKSSMDYDYIFCINAINHVRDINMSLKMLNQNLKSDGLIILSTDTHKHNFLRSLFQWLPGDILHPQQYNSQDYERMLERSNFIVKKKIVLKSGTIFDYCVFIAGKKSDS